MGNRPLRWATPGVTLCPRCFSEMRVIWVIEDPVVIKKILKHLGPWDVKRKPRPAVNAPPIDVFPA